VFVRDAGEGIPSAELERIFERFHRVDTGLTRRTGGAGLGLYIARRLIEAMDGRLRVESSPGQGSVFCFSLPLIGDRKASQMTSPADGAASSHPGVF
jgi:signal transduction histidine kinase